MRPGRLSLAVLLLALPLAGKRLPIRTYTTADGLARDSINCIVQDSHAFLWICTAEGLSRFDGYQFTNYQTQQGLPSNSIRSFLETRRGAYWIATDGGVARFDPRGTPRFRVYPLDRPNASPATLLEDREGGIWCSARVFQGVFHLGPKDTAFRHVDMPGLQGFVSLIFLDRRGVLWVGTSEGLYRRDPGGAVTVLDAAGGLRHAFLMALLEDHAGRMWAGTREGLVRMDGGGGAARIYTVKDGLPHRRIESLLETSDGKLWVGTAEGLAIWAPAEVEGGREFQAFTQTQGLSARTVGPMAEDGDGNLWIGTYGSGAMKMARNGFTTYTEADGLPLVQSFLRSRQGEMCAYFRVRETAGVSCFDGRHFESYYPAWPAGITYFGWGRGQALAQDRTGEWWIATGHGLCRFARSDGAAGLAGAAPRTIYTRRDGLPGDEIFTVFGDSQDRIWIGTIGLQQQDGMAMWDRGSGQLRVFGEADGLPEKPLPEEFAEDRGGDIWVALFHGGLARYRQGRFTVFGEHEGIGGFLQTVFVDSAGRLWIGCLGGGLIRVDDPTAEQPHFAVYGPAQGLSSNYIVALTEDRWGRIYAATGRGIDRFEPQPNGLGRIRRYTTADGVTPGEIDLAFRDPQGNLWFNSPLGLSQLVPTVDAPRPAPPVLLTGLSVGGVAQPISDLGESAVTGLRLPQRPLRVDYVGLGFRAGSPLRYQYMLEGADRDWSAPTDQRTVIYGNLAPGGYRFRVRALADDGVASPNPARVEFRILPPVWRTWWFLLTCGGAVALLTYALHRYRVAQVLAVANVRTRIATDLHDDIGASLSQIAVLSEVARRGAGHEAGAGGPLAEIAGISRELVDSMSDIVWAINPEHDRLGNLVFRMRRFSTDLLGSQGIAVEFRSSLADHELRIGANARRQIYLIFKEGIHNIARHSGAGRVEIALDREGDALTLRLKDDGRGFEVNAPAEGHGLANIRKRAALLGARVEWRSEPGKGTTFGMRAELGLEKTLAMLRGRVTGRFR